MGKAEIDKLVKIWQAFADQQTSDKFFLNSNKKRVEQLAKGVLENEKNHGLKFCPCRLTTGRFDDDIKIICPCNFKMQKTWQEKGECWCSLFVKNHLLKQVACYDHSKRRWFLSMLGNCSSLPRAKATKRSSRAISDM